MFRLVLLSLFLLIFSPGVWGAKLPDPHCDPLGALVAKPPDVPLETLIASNPPTKIKFDMKEMDKGMRREDAIKGVTYAKGALRAALRVYVHEGKLYDAKGMLLQRPEWSSFAMDEAGDIYVFNGVALAHSIINHSTYLAGEPAASTGNLKVVDGVIVLMNDGSGHYKPQKKHMLQAQSRLKELGYDLPTDRIIARASAGLPDSPEDK